MDVSRTIDKLDKKTFCSGCGACYNVCPKDAITMQYNEEGFHEPVIDPEKCVSCGMCEKVCPALHPKKDNDNEPDVYAVKGDKKILKYSTSGGVFALLAEYILSKEGYVCGAAYNDSFEVWHRIENTYEGVQKIKKSKYVQSQTGLVFREIKKLLEEDKWVLFSGAPCQVAGLHNYLGRSYDKLYTMDIICHGGPAPMSWKRYLDENINIEKIKDIDFRHKGNHGFKKLYINFTYSNGKTDTQPSSKNKYYNHFLKNLGLRKSCTACQGAVVPRVGDFSAGDFWGAEKLHPEWIESDSGISVIFFNNAHAKELYPFLKERFAFMEKITVEEAMTSNRNKVARKMHCNRERYFEMLKTETFNEAVRKNMGKPFDVAVYGNTIGTNYGGIVTYYALYKTLVNMGLGTVMIRPPKKKKEEKKSHAVKFFEDNVVLSNETSLDKYSSYNDLAEVFVLGSDQVWNYNLFKGRKLSFYLDFVKDSKKKIAYAASFGFEKPTIFPDYEHLYPAISKLMKRFDAIGVREADGVSICNDYFEVPAKHVLDPVFLLPVNEYTEIANQAKRKPEGKYMAVYTLTPKEMLSEGLQYVSKELNLPRVNMGPGNPQKWKRKSKNFDEPYQKNVTMQEWLYNIENSDFVMTDSYHCVCFSIIFRKNFILIQDAWAVSRIKSLLTKLNLTDRWFVSSEELMQHPEVLAKDIDYDAVYEILEKEIDDSLDWLRKAVKAKKNVTISDSVEVELGKKMSYGYLYKAFTAGMYLRGLKKHQKDLVIAMVQRGDKIPKILNYRLFIPKMKKGKGFACIYDSEEKKLIEQAADMSHIQYTRDNVNFAACSEGKKYNSDNPYAEITIDKEGKREIYTCDKDGIYILVYSKTDKMVVDFVRIDERKVIHR